MIQGPETIQNETAFSFILNVFYIILPGLVDRFKSSPKPSNGVQNGNSQINTIFKLAQHLFAATVLTYTRILLFLCEILNTVMQLWFIYSFIYF